MEIKGRLLLFDELNSDGSLFTKDCNITIPEKMPLVWNFKLHDPDDILGTAIVKRDDEGLILTGEIINQKFSDLLNKEVIENIGLGIGGFYNQLKYDETEYVKRIITSCNLVLSSIVTDPVNPKYTFEIIESED